MTDDNLTGPSIRAIDEAGVRRITISNETRLNALSRAMVDEMRDLVADFTGDDALKVLIFTGAGERAFCAGADIKEMAEIRASGQRFEPNMPALFRLVLKSDKPTIARLNGDTAGGGFELAMSCDLRVARSGIRLGLPEVKKSMVPRFGTALLTGKVSYSTAMEVAMLGDLISAERAKELNIVHRVVDGHQLDDATNAIADELCSLDINAIKSIKTIAREAESIEKISNSDWPYYSAS